MYISMNCEKPNCIIFNVKIIFNQPKKILFRPNIGQSFPFFPASTGKRKNLILNENSGNFDAKRGKGLHW